MTSLCQFESKQATVIVICNPEKKKKLAHPGQLGELNKFTIATRNEKITIQDVELLDLPTEPSSCLATIPGPDHSYCIVLNGEVYPMAKPKASTCSQVNYLIIQSTMVSAVFSIVWALATDPH